MSANEATKKLSRALPSSLSAYHDLVEEILREMLDQGWDEKTLFGIHMALEESITNAIRHGNKEAPDKMVQVECEISADRFWAKIRDEGEGYEPGSIPDCCAPENLEAPGGRGLALIRAYMDNVKLSKKGACLTMEKFRKDPPEAE